MSTTRPDTTGADCVLAEEACENKGGIHRHHGPLCGQGLATVTKLTSLAKTQEQRMEWMSTFLSMNRGDFTDLTRKAIWVIAMCRANRVPELFPDQEAAAEIEAGFDTYLYRLAEHTYEQQTTPASVPVPVPLEDFTMA